MLRLLTLLLVALLAACSSAPQRTVRSSGASSTAGAYRTPPGFPDFVDHSIGREEISIQAMSLVGVPYRWGGNTPDSGFDCSGLVHYVVQRAASVNLPRTTADMSSRGASIEPDEIAAGDLVFFNTTGRSHSHVGIYVGKLRFVNAPSTGGTVRLDYLTNPYWAKRFDGIRRVAPPLAPSKPTPFDGATYDASAPSPRDGDPAGVPLAAPAAAQVAVDGRQQVPVTAQRDNRITAARAPAAAMAGPAAVATTGTTTGSATGATTAAPASTAADAFEPPPAAMSAAQSQARDAGAVSPVRVASPASAPVNGTGNGAASANMMATQTTQPAQSGAAYADAPARVSAQAPDPIDAAADAYEPPPSAALAARQAQQAQQTPSEWQRPASGSARIMRASTVSPSLPAPTQTNDDPIAGFANSSY
ncbi:C40 family peptidase [Paraburkholderia humisilvae]|uniref:C40 family peptidase n=1 Tax=Paraburkholderia humisilvae TaxID=627669 RepID=UPI001581F72D|nr:C40 family peptidase [Paraburkholderia humisilvae]